MLLRLSRFVFIFQLKFLLWHQIVVIFGSHLWNQNENRAEKNSIEKCFSLLWYLLSTAFCHKLACGQIVKLNQKWSRIDIFALNKENRLNQISNLQNLPYAWERRCSVIASENNKSCFIVEINLWMTSHSNIIANVVRIFIFFSLSLSVRVSIKLYTFLTHFDLLQQQKIVLYTSHLTHKKTEKQKKNDNRTKNGWK